MKFILESPHTEVLLSKGASGSWMKIGYFFYDRGSSNVQNTTYGLLAKVLHNMVDIEHGLARHIISDREQPSTSHGRRRAQDVESLKDRSWTEAQLRRALDVLLNQTSTPLHLCLFIDALDEEHGSHWEMLNTLEELFVWSDSPAVKVKMCLASRPENEFFRLRRYKGFRMQDYTHQDIITYTEKMFKTGGLTYEFKDDFVRWAIRYIIENARGVFIWVKLATHLLIEGIHHGDTDEELQDLLQDVPHDLDVLYTEAIRRMMSKRSFSEDRRLKDAFEAHCMYQLALHALRPWKVTQFLELIAAVLSEAFNKRGCLGNGPGPFVKRHQRPPRTARGGKSRESIGSDATLANRDVAMPEAPAGVLRIASRSAGLLETVTEVAQYVPDQDFDTASHELESSEQGSESSEARVRRYVDRSQENCEQPTSQDAQSETREDESVRSYTQWRVRVAGSQFVTRNSRHGRTRSN